MFMNPVTYTLTKNDVVAINRYISLSEDSKNMYFWTPPSVAALRRVTEEKNHLRYSSIINGKELVLSFTLSCSCKNYYVYKTITFGGVKKDIRFLRKILANFIIVE